LSDVEAREPARAGWRQSRLLALLPIVLLVAAVSVFAATGTSLTSLIGQTGPPADEFAIRRVTFKPGEIRIRVTNPQRTDLTIGSVTVDDAIVPYDVDGPRTLGRLRSATIVVPYDWVEEDPISVGVTSSTGIETTEEIAAAVETPSASGRSFFGYALIGILVGIVPVALGLLWLPSLRRADQNWLAAFMALTAGLLTFLALDALSEALSLQAGLPESFQGVGLVLLGVAASYLGLAFLSRRLSAREGRERGLGALGLATLVAVGIGLHNLGEGLAIGSSFALGELTLGTFLIVGFMIHNLTEGLGIAAPLAEGAAVRTARLVVLALVAGAPAIAGAWIGGFLVNDVVGVLFFAIAVGAALQVVVEVGRFLMRRAPGGLGSGWVIGGFLAGIVVMYATGLLVA
jgi:zinc transporter, ZIP family